MTEQKREDFLYVPYGCTVHGEEEINAVEKVLRTSTQMGPHVREFEEKVAATFDKPHGIMVNSGSSALFVAVEVLDLPKGSEVITPALTFATTVGCLVKNDLIPAFVDVEEGTYCIDPEKIEAMITEKTSAVCIPNLIGNICDWDSIVEICRKHDLKIIEDSADTLGGTLQQRSSGHYSDISITSFYGSHVINGAGNGGMLCVKDDAMAAKARLLRSWGRSSSLFVESEAIENRFNVKVDGIDYDAKFVFETVGYQLEPSEISAAFALVQFDKLEGNIKAREEFYQKQYDFFAQYEDWFILPKQTTESRTGWLAFPLTIREGAPFTRREMQIFLEKRNIQTRVVFTGNITRQPGFKDIEMKKATEGYPVSDHVMRGGVLLACHHGLTDEMLDHVHSSFRLFAAQFK
ncbi:DegT/DnrJ/EryC1/StrS family aminotransferase [Endozoicomonas arenosclerae]|uniref:DegT/DnrJ/EryC1/StrS family aminotransferase n=1 Tax=Endozoicomonas arenosclerae TaxID=1633495 RepID=UPI000781FEA8|nr:aminotransferase class I/II-fold pyridoxal phosphate-dependent enzyme [Endozoicomonas arenosclerae]